MVKQAQVTHKGGGTIPGHFTVAGLTMPPSPPTPSILTASRHTKKINSSLIISLYLDTLENFFSHNLKADLPIINTSISLDPTWLSNTSVQLSNGILIATQPWQLFLMKQLHRQNTRLGIKKLALSWERVYLHSMYPDPHNRKPELSFRLDFVGFLIFLQESEMKWMNYLRRARGVLLLSAISLLLSPDTRRWLDTRLRLTPNLSASVLSLDQVGGGLGEWFVRSM